MTVAGCGGSAVSSSTDGGRDSGGAAGAGGAGAGAGGAGGTVGAGGAAGAVGGSVGSAGGAAGGGGSAGGAGGVTGAGGAGQGSTSYNYEFSELSGANVCDTGQQNFTTLAAMCAGLESDSLNHACALAAREAFFGLHCTGTFQEAP
ncbi:MAG TPA: hypothetical protein VGP07_11410 [Polyangia bacterium]